MYGETKTEMLRIRLKPSYKAVLEAIAEESALSMGGALCRAFDLYNMHVIGRTVLGLVEKEQETGEDYGERMRELLDQAAVLREDAERIEESDEAARIVEAIELALRTRPRVSA